MLKVKLPKNSTNGRKKIWNNEFEGGKNMGDNELIAYKIVSEKQKENRKTKKKKKK
jgi:hypothetical protein